MTQMKKILVSGSLSLLVLAGCQSVSAETGKTVDAMQVLNRALQEAERAEGRAFAYTLTANTPDGPVAARFDPTKSGGARWKLISPAKGSAGWSAKAKSAFAEMQNENHPETLLTMDDFRKTIGTPKVVSQSRNEIVFEFQPHPVASDGMLGRRIESRLLGEATLSISPPRFEQVRFYAPEPFQISPLASVQSLEEKIEVIYLPSINGVVARSMSINIKGNALVSAFIHDMNVSATDIEPAE